MSVSYWGIKGYGVNLDDVNKYIDNKKVNEIIRLLNPNITFEEYVFDDCTFYGDPYSSFGEFLSDLDDTGTLTWEDGGNSEKCYFLYVPPYPWQTKSNEPKSEKEIEDRIIKTLLRICETNTDPEDIRKYIEYIDDYGCG